MTFLWTPEWDAELRRLRAEGRSYSAIAVRFGISRSAVIGRAARLDGRGSGYEGKRHRARRNLGQEQGWTEQALTEPWTVYHARKKAERQAARQADLCLP